MKKYTIIVNFSIDDVYEIEAESKEDASLEALQRLWDMKDALRFREFSEETTIEVEEQK